jgi:hypothetical protein
MLLSSIRVDPRFLLSSHSQDPGHPFLIVLELDVLFVNSMYLVFFAD